MGGLFQVAAGDMEHSIGLAAGASAHEHGIGSSAEAGRATYLVDEILGLLFAGVVHEQDRHLVTVRQGFDSGHAVVVELIGEIARGRSAQPGEHIHDDQTGVGVLVEPGGDALVTALRHGRALDREGEGFRAGVVVGKHHPQPTLEAPCRVLQCQVQDLAGIDLNLA